MCEPETPQSPCLILDQNPVITITFPWLDCLKSSLPLGTLHDLPYLCLGKYVGNDIIQ